MCLQCVFNVFYAHWDCALFSIAMQELLPKSVPYSNVCGALLWISRMVRVDCMLQRTAELARAMHAPTWRHWGHAKRTSAGIPQRHNR